MSYQSTQVASGIYKRRRFDMPHSFKAHPTMDFAKEDLFNALFNYIDSKEDARALDLFANIGSTSIELVSKDCGQVISIEKDRNHYAFICKMMRGLKIDKCLPVRGDVFKYTRGGHEQSDLTFADPSYELKGLETLPDLIFENNFLREEGLFVLECRKANNFGSHLYFIERRMYGSINSSFF